MNKQKLEKAVKWVCMGDSDSLWNAEDYLSVFQDFFKAYRFLQGGSIQKSAIARSSTSWTGCLLQTQMRKFQWSRVTIPFI